jgi:hypothetical protein
MKALMSLVRARAGLVAVRDSLAQKTLDAAIQVSGLAMPGAAKVRTAL